MRLRDRFRDLHPPPRGVLRKDVIPGELCAHRVQGCDSKGVIKSRVADWAVRRAYRSSILGMRWRDLMAGDGGIFFSVCDHWVHVAMLGTGWSIDNTKMAASDWRDCGCGNGAFE